MEKFFKIVLRNEYVVLCDGNIFVMLFLFGDDLLKLFKEVR